MCFKTLYLIKLVVHIKIYVLVLPQTEYDELPWNISTFLNTIHSVVVLFHRWQLIFGKASTKGGHQLWSNRNWRTLCKPCLIILFLFCFTCYWMRNTLTWIKTVQSWEIIVYSSKWSWIWTLAERLSEYFLNPSELLLLSSITAESGLLADQLVTPRSVGNSQINWLDIESQYSAHTFPPFPVSVTALCSEGPMFRRSYGYVQKFLCSEGSMFRKSYGVLLWNYYYFFFSDPK